MRRIRPAIIRTGLMEVWKFLQHPLFLSQSFALFGLGTAFPDAAQRLGGYNAQQTQTDMPTSNAIMAVNNHMWLDDQMEIPKKMLKIMAQITCSEAAN